MAKLQLYKHLREEEIQCSCASGHDYLPVARVVLIHLDRAFLEGNFRPDCLVFSDGVVVILFLVTFDFVDCSSFDIANTLCCFE
jgi:hypothetical protein